MTKPNSPKHNLQYVLIEVCGKATEALFDKRVKDLRPAGHDPDTWTVDSFLQANKNKILSSKMGNDKKCTIFPKEQDNFLKKGNLDDYIFLLVEICELGDDMIQNLYQLRCVFIKVIQMDDAVINDREYKDCLKKLKFIVKRCQTEINDTHFTQEVESMVEQMDSGAVPQSSLIAAMQKMKSMKEIVQLYNLEHIQNTNYTDGEKLDIITELIRCIDARLHFSHLHAWNKVDVDEKKEKKMDQTYVGEGTKYEPTKPKSTSSPLMEML